MTPDNFWNLFAKKLAQEATEEELLQLEEHLKRHPELAYSADYLQHAWKAPADGNDLYLSQIAFDGHIKKMQADGLIHYSIDAANDLDVRKKRFLLKPRMTIVVLLMVISFCGFIWWRNVQTEAPLVPVFSEVNTKAGSRSTKVVLPDSTIVWLNAGSRITYDKDFGRTHRNTTLTGEAFFDVRKSRMPFIIFTEQVRIRVLGTAFNVKSYPGEKTETSLIRGEVEITLDKRPGEKWLLKPNEKLIVSHTPSEKKASQKKEPLVVLAPIEPMEDESILETSWIDNRLVFQDETFASLATRMERWYGMNIRIEDERIASQRLSGSFTNETAREAMDLLRMITPFHYHIKSNQIIITP